MSFKLFMCKYFRNHEWVHSKKSLYNSDYSIKIRRCICCEKVQEMVWENHWIDRIDRNY